ERFGAAWGGHLGGVAFLLADHGPRDRGGDRDLAFGDIGLVLAYDLVDEGLFGVLVHDRDGGAELDRRAFQLGRIDDVGPGELVLKLGDAAFDEALALLGGVVFRILGKIAMAARFGDRRDHGGAFFGLQSLQLGLEGFKSLGR